MLDYIRDPAEIYRQSFDTIRAETDLSNIPGAMAEIAVRMIHACGMTDIVDDLAFSEGAAGAGRDALGSGAPVICDVEMVRRGIIRRMLPADNELICMIGVDENAVCAKRMGNTRSAAAMELCRSSTGGSVVVVGNAPTALFHLLEMIDDGAEKPALIIATPVGFVGAVESKDELIRNPRGVPFITVKGRRGGSALAAAAVNAICGLATS